MKSKKGYQAPQLPLLVDLRLANVVANSLLNIFFCKLHSLVGTNLAFKTSQEPLTFVMYW